MAFFSQCWTTLAPARGRTGSIDARFGAGYRLETLSPDFGLVWDRHGVIRRHDVEARFPREVFAGFRGADVARGGVDPRCIGAITVGWPERAVVGPLMRGAIARPITVAIPVSVAVSIAIAVGTVAIAVSVATVDEQLPVRPVGWSWNVDPALIEPLAIWTAVLATVTVAIPRFEPVTIIATAVAVVAGAVAAVPIAVAFAMRASAVVKTSAATTWLVEPLPWFTRLAVNRIAGLRIEGARLVVAWADVWLTHLRARARLFGRQRRQIATEGVGLLLAEFATLVELLLLARAAVALFVCHLLAMGEDDAVVVLGVLEIVLSENRIARRQRITRQRQVLIGDRLGRAGDFSVRTVAVVGARQRVLGLALVVMTPTAAALMSAAVAPAPAPPVLLSLPHRVLVSLLLQKKLWVQFRCWFGSTAQCVMAIGGRLAGMWPVAVGITRDFSTLARPHLRLDRHLGGRSDLQDVRTQTMSEVQT